MSERLAAPERLADAVATAAKRRDADHLSALIMTIGLTTTFSVIDAVDRMGVVAPASTATTPRRLPWTHA